MKHRKKLNPYNASNIIMCLVLLAIAIVVIAIVFPLFHLLWAIMCAGPFFALCGLAVIGAIGILIAVLVLICTK